MRDDVRALAEDPDLYVEPAPGAIRIVEDGYCLTIDAHRRWADVCRLRLRTDEVVHTVAAVRGETHEIPSVVWNVGSSATPPDLPARLRALGFGDPDPPHDAVVAAMVLTT